MDDSRWQPTLLIRTSIVLHLLALIVVIAEPVQWRWAVCAVLANHALLTLAGLWPRSHWLGSNWAQFPAAAIARNEIALTVDDGNVARTSDGIPVILEVLPAILSSAAAAQLRFVTLCQANRSGLVSILPHPAENKP